MAKYTDEEYLEGGYFGPDEETSHNLMRIVTTRKEQKCVGCYGSKPHPIPPGSRAINETAIHEEEGRVSCYVCLSCADGWLDVVYDGTEPNNE